MKKILFAAMAIIMTVGLGACAPEVGSEKWCKMIKEKPSGERTIDETKNYAKHCLFK